MARFCGPSHGTWAAVTLLMACSRLAIAESPQFAEPIFQTGVPHATQDKPQSKIWFAHGRWWAWLPLPNGSTVIERTADGWRELAHLRSILSGLPGQADVWCGETFARAVLVGKDRLAVVQIDFDKDRGTYVSGTLRCELEISSQRPAGSRVETATICQDASGRWWIAYDRDRSVHVCWTTDSSGMAWSAPLTLGENTSSDDICAIFSLPDRVGVLWSDQVGDAVLFREHRNGALPERWSPTIVVEQGGKNADDHLNGALASDGTLYVATKNSVDLLNQPQQVLRIRRPDGTWENHPYANLTPGLAPTRPIVILGGATERLFLLHTCRGFIAIQESDRNELDLAVSAERLLSASQPINNVTGPKAFFPDSGPWIVLASDAEGGVYEADLSQRDRNGE
ncbi:MAG: hypothetical protein KF861_02485 [Planctomycetaceae bacterium]|nr:hypothetical protein [Planctomycetaceae bacterium]